MQIFKSTGDHCAEYALYFTTDEVKNLADIPFFISLFTLSNVIMKINYFDEGTGSL